MSKQNLVSFENNTIKVVQTVFRRDSLFIEKASTFSDTEFDRYLKTSKDDGFIVISDFQNISQDVISIPPAGGKYLVALISQEIKKRVPDLADFTFFYEELREIQREGKRSKEISFFAVPREDVNTVINRFEQAGKTVVALYPNVLPLSRFIQIEGEGQDGPLMGVVDLGTSKAFFLTQNHKLAFVRATQSDNPGISNLDIENANMTIAYCRQVLRLSPSRVVFFGGIPASVPIVPVALPKYPASIVATEDTISQYVIPLSAAIHIKELAGGSLLPAAYQGIIAQRKLLGYAVIILILFSFLGLCYAGIKTADILMTQNQTTAIRKNIALKEHIIADYEKSSAEFSRIGPLVKYLAIANASADMQKILASLQVFGTEKIKINAINLKKDETAGVVLVVEGNIESLNYKELQTNYEQLLRSAKDLKELHLTSQTLELKEKLFRIEMKWATS